ncbi:MAG: ankyrin repeat domain-containing protein [Planctomycetota bacterium]|jgi:ankyrin repeat protein/acetyl esterase/lipase
MVWKSKTIHILGTASLIFLVSIYSHELNVANGAAEKQAAQTPSIQRVERYVYKQTAQGELAMYVHFPRDWTANDQRPGIVFFFGGGWVGGTVQELVPHAEYLAKRGMVTARAEYRIKSRHGTTPDKCVEDGKSAIRWIRANAAKLGIDPDRIAASGVSAGGHVAASTYTTKGLEAKGEETSISSKPNLLVLFEPVLQCSGLVRQVGSKEMAVKISPYDNLTQDIPPVVVFCGMEDWLAVEAVEFVDKCKQLGVIAELYTAEGQEHGSLLKSPWFERAICLMDKFLARYGYTQGEPTMRLPEEDIEMKKILPTSLNVEDTWAYTPLHRAARNGQKELVKALIANGADVNVKDNWFTPLFYTFRCGDKELVEFLIDNDADVNAKVRWDRTLLYYAAGRGDKELIELFIEKGADVNVKDRTGDTPLHNAVKSRTAGKDIIELLITNGADVNAKNDDGQTPVDVAVRQNRSELAKLVIEKGTDVSLHAAARFGAVAKARSLIEKGIEIDAKDISGQTALHYAAEYGHKDIVGLLIANGADVNAKTNNGESPLEIALAHNHKEISDLLVTGGTHIPSIHTAAQLGDVDKVKGFLGQSQDMNARDENNRTALHEAVRSKHKDIAQFLIEQGADVNAKGKRGYTPLYSAIWNGDVNMVKLLVSKGAEVNYSPERDYPPLHYAIWMENTDIAKLLLDHEASLDAKDQDGKTALSRALEKGHTEIAEIFRTREFWLMCEQNRVVNLSKEGPTITITDGKLSIDIVPQQAQWSVKDLMSGTSLEGIRPVFDIRDLPVDLGSYKSEYTEKKVSDPLLGASTCAIMNYHKDGELDIIYTLMASETNPEMWVRVDFTNQTHRKLMITRVAPVVVDRVRLPSELVRWHAVSDAKRNRDPYTRVQLGRQAHLNGWWHMALRNRQDRHSLILASLDNNKGLGRFYLIEEEVGHLRIAGSHGYENIIMPPGARIVGERLLVQFGRTGNDSLERFGCLVAKAHGVDLRRRIPVAHHGENNTLGIFNSFIPWGASVIDGFEYRKYDREKFQLPYDDRQWVRACYNSVIELGLRDFGYMADTGLKLRGFGGGSTYPLARNYGRGHTRLRQPSVVSDKPEWFRLGKIDFSNPEVIQYERNRVAELLKGIDTQTRISYAWDFTTEWMRLPNQYDPFQTSAETYRTAMGIWRELTDEHHRQGGIATLMMNIVGLNYGLVDFLRVGADSDHGFHPHPTGRAALTFTQGLIRQISGRYFYNGWVWWNNPDSFHVYAGGLYSYHQGKVHATFNSLAGGRMWFSEPFIEYGEPFPPDRLEIVKRVTPITNDVSRAIDLFEHCPAHLWSMSIERPFGKWQVVGLFNFDFDKSGQELTQTIDFEELGLLPDKEYLVYEFWTSTFLGIKKGSFTRTVAAPNCEVYAIVEKQGHPVLISTSRHVRQMAYDIRDLKWDDDSLTLAGCSHMTRSDPYELRIYVPPGYNMKEVTVSDLPVGVEQTGRILKVGFQVAENIEQAWQVEFVNGADVSTKDMKGRIPLWYTQEMGHTEIAELLRKHGAKE